MRKTLIFSSTFLIFALMTTIPVALCAQPPPSPWPPEPEWHPCEPSKPDGTMVLLVPAVPPIAMGPIGASEPFYLYTGWFFLPTNEAYYWDTGDPVPPEDFWCLQDHTDFAGWSFIAVTVDDVHCTPTGSFTGTCKWYPFYVIRDSAYTLAVAPSAIRLQEYYIEFPDGLPAGSYEIRIHCRVGRYILEGGGTLVIPTP